MKTFITNYKGNRIINIAHIVDIHLSAPQYEQKNWIVGAQLTYGTAILFEGTESECRNKLGEYYENL